MSAETDFELQEFLPYLLNQAAEASGLEFQRIYKERYGILRTEWRVLFHLGLYGEMTAVEIGRRARMHKTKISRAVQKLEDRRFLTRRRDGGDRRFEQLSLTDAGRAAYRDLSAIARIYNARLENRLGAEEARILRQALLRLMQV